MSLSADQPDYYKSGKQITYKTTSINAALEETLPGVICGKVWDDSNSNALWDADENGVEGQVVYLDQNCNGVLDGDDISTTTSRDGNYIFRNLAPGPYTVAQVCGSNWNRTFPNQSASNSPVQFIQDWNSFINLAQTTSTETFDEYLLNTYLSDGASVQLDRINYLAYYGNNKWRAGGESGAAGPLFASSPNALAYNGIEVEGCRLSFDNYHCAHALGFWLLSNKITPQPHWVVTVEEANQRSTSFEVDCVNGRTYCGFFSPQGITSVSIRDPYGDNNQSAWCFDDVSRSEVEVIDYTDGVHTVDLAPDQIALNVNFGIKSTGPIAPCCPHPENMSKYNLLNTDLSWSGNAASYKVYFGTNPDLGPANYLGTTQETTWDLPTLQPETTYYWQIVTADNGIQGPVWQFTTTLENGPAGPKPADKAINVPLNTDLVWGFGTGDLGFEEYCWSHYAISSDGLVKDHWTKLPSGNVTASGPWYSGPTEEGRGDTALESSDIDLTYASSALFKFDQMYHFDDCNDPSFQPDGGVVEVKVVGESEWTPIVPMGGYPGIITAQDNPLRGRPAYTHDSGGIFRHTEIDLSKFADKIVRVRFRVGWDGGNCERPEGWYIDNVYVSMISSDNVDASFNVYFSKDPGLLSGSYQGTTSNMHWDLPALEKGTTYYWQINSIIQNTVTPGPVWSFTTASDSIGTVKQSVDGTEASICGVVTALFGGSFYVEQADRSSGICVKGSAEGLTRGALVVAKGKIATNANGERCIAAASISSSKAAEIQPVMLRNRNIGGSDMFADINPNAGQHGIYGSVGLNNIGLLVKTTGRVTASGSSSREGVWFYVDDGSNVQDGTGVKGIYVKGGLNIAIPEPNALVAVTGVSSCAYYNGKLVNVILVRDSNDVMPILSNDDPPPPPFFAPMQAVSLSPREAGQIN